jgi:uncharacterized Fe-S cluster protein YjdI
VKRYEGKHIEVTYDTARCLHAAECVRGMPAVFDTAKRPWIDPDSADAEALAAVIRRCPTGALHYTLAEGERERPSVPTRIRLPAGGPLLLEGDLELDGKKRRVRPSAAVANRRTSLTATVAGRVSNGSTSQATEHRDARSSGCFLSNLGSSLHRYLATALMQGPR